MSSDVPCYMLKMACTHSLLRSLGNGRCPHCEPLQGVFRRDGWQNVATGIGTTSDKRSFGAVRLEVVTAAEARDLWRANDLAARIIEAGPARRAPRWSDLDPGG